MSGGYIQFLVIWWIEFCLLEFNYWMIYIYYENFENKEMKECCVWGLYLKEGVMFFLEMDE